MRRKNAHYVLLLNCTPKSDPDEANFLAQLMESIELEYPNVHHRMKHVRSSAELTKHLASKWPTIVHISSHGGRWKRPSTKKVETGIVVGGWEFYASDIRKMTGRISAELVFTNACSNSYRDMAQAIIGKGAEYFCAPKIDIYWADAVVYTAMFYRYLLWKRKSVEKAGEFAARKTGLTYAYPDWWKTVSK